MWVIRARSYQPYYVVDGQQRLTTTIVLLQVMLETLKEGSTLNFLDVDFPRFCRHLLRSKLNWRVSHEESEIYSRIQI